MGIVLRNGPFGEDDGEIILKTLKARVALVLADDANAELFDLTKDDFKTFNNDSLNTTITKESSGYDTQTDEDTEGEVFSDTDERNYGTDTDGGADTDDNDSDDGSMEALTKKYK